MTSPKPSASPAAGGTFSDTARSILSLVILIHFCCVFVVLASSFRRSPLLERLIEIFGPYTQGLVFDPGTVPYYHTLGRLQDDDAVLLVDLYPDSESPLAGQTLIKTVELPASESPWLESRRRYLALAKVIQVNAPEDEEAEEGRDRVCAEIAKAVGRRVIEENRISADKAPRAVVRCVRRMSQPRNLTELNPGFPPDEPTAAAYDIPLYTADVLIDEDGQTLVVKRASRSELAPRQNNP